MKPENKDDKGKRLASYIIVIFIIIFIVSLSIYLTPENGNNAGETQFKDNETKKKQIILTNSQEKQIKVLAEVANEPDEREKGLMNQKSLCENCGILFIYEENVTNSFWMKNTTIPLSIAFISNNGTIIKIQKMEPNTVTLHKPKKPYQYALEVNQGFFQENNIYKGNKVTMPGKISN